MNKKSQKLQTRDFISVGIFSLIYAAVAFIIGGIAQMTCRITIHVLHHN